MLKIHVYKVWRASMKLIKTNIYVWKNSNMKFLFSKLVKYD